MVNLSGNAIQIQDIFETGQFKGYLEAHMEPGVDPGYPLSDTRHNLQFGNCRCSGHAKPQFNYYTRVNWLAGGTVTRNGVQIDLGSSLCIDLLLLHRLGLALIEIAEKSLPRFSFTL